MLGVPSPPPFLDPSSVGSKILNGVNYASASSGILDDSGRHYVLYILVSIILNFLFYHIREFQQLLFGYAAQNLGMWLCGMKITWQTIQNIRFTLKDSRFKLLYLFLI